MSTTSPENSNLSDQAARHLWMHFSRMGSYEDHEVPVIVRGEGAYVWDQHGKRYLDGLAGLFTSQTRPRAHRAGRGRRQAGRDARLLPAVDVRPPPRHRAGRAARRLRPGRPQPRLLHLRRLRGGRVRLEAGPPVLPLIGQPQRTKVISRDIAYHGTTMGALSITGIPDLRTPFEPLVPGAIKVPNTNFYRAESSRDDEVAFGRWAADEIERAILREGPRRWPRSSSSRCRTPAGASPRRRATSSGSARSATATACCSSPTRSSAPSAAWATGSAPLRYDYQPDIITVAKGLTSGYAPLGAMIASDRLMEPFLGPGASFLHGFTFAGHPVSCAVALANLDVFEGEQILQHVQSTEAGVPCRARGPLRPADRRRRARRGLLLRHRAGQGQGDPRAPSTTRSPSACCAASSPARSSRPA